MHYICLVLWMLTKKCICGYYVYNTFWSATVGEELQCAKKLGNVKDRYVTLINHNMLYGH